MKPRHLTTSLTTELLDKVKYILLDVDGVLWSGETVIPQIPETIHWLKEVKGKQVRYMTNNSTMSRKEMVIKFRQHGITDITEKEIYSSAFAAALKLKHVAAENPTKLSDASGRFNRNVFVIGNNGFHDEIEKVLAPGKHTYGRELAGCQTERQKQAGFLDFQAYKPANVAAAVVKPVLPPPKSYPDQSKGITMGEIDAGAVTVAFDFQANMTKLAIATMLLRDPSVPFIASNPDPQLPYEVQGETVLLPGAGTLVNFVKVATGREPDAVCGKPETLMMEMLFENEGINDPSECLMVGDRLTTDIQFGLGAKVQTLFVLSGCEKESDIQAFNIVPHYISPSLASLMTLSAASSSKL